MNIAPTTPRAVALDELEFNSATKKRKKKLNTNTSITQSRIEQCEQCDRLTSNAKNIRTFSVSSVFDIHKKEINATKIVFSRMVQIKHLATIFRNNIY